MHGKKIQEVWGTRTHYERPTDQVATSPNLSAQAGRHRSPALHTRSQDPQGQGCFFLSQHIELSGQRQTDGPAQVSQTLLILHIILRLSAVMSVSGFSGAGCVWVLSLCVLLLSSGRCGPVPPPEERRSAPGVGDEVDMQEVLGQLLQALNWTDQGPRPRPRAEPPEYMLELYNRFNNDRSAAPSANIVRSFRNEGEEAQFLAFGGYYRFFSQLLAHTIFPCHTVSESCHSNSRNTPNLQNQTLIISFQFHKTQHTVLSVTHTNLTGIHIMAKVFANAWF